MINISIPWKAWYGDEEFNLSFPDDWSVNVCPMRGAPFLEEEKIEEAFEKPIGQLRLRKLAEKKGTAAIVLDDISRPTKGEQILKPVIGELESGGITKNNIKIILALACHRPMIREDIIKKVGEDIYQTVDVLNHHPYENIVDYGVSACGTPIKINRYFMESDLKLSISCIIPHELAGFGGGAKNILPGVSGIETVEANHKIMEGIHQGMTGVCQGNNLREDIEDIARKIGLDAIVNVVTNESRDIVGVFVGDVIKAHRSGVELAREVFATEVVYDQDVIILNAYPKDTEIHQLGMAFNLYHSANEKIVKPDGIVVLTSACSEGRGFHSLFGQGNRMAYNPEKLGDLFKGRTGIIFSPNLTRFDIYHMFHETVHFFNQWEKVVQFIQEKKGNKQKVAIYPTAPMQLAK